MQTQTKKADLVLTAKERQILDYECAEIRKRKEGKKYNDAKACDSGIEFHVSVVRKSDNRSQRNYIETIFLTADGIRAQLKDSDNYEDGKEYSVKITPVSTGSHDRAQKALLRYLDAIEARDPAPKMALVSNMMEKFKTATK
jgi:DNA-binding GntR family transcriptional regulator